MTPKVDREKDLERRRQAQHRRPLISQWPVDVPAGYVHIDDCIEYMRRRWGKMIRTEHYEAFSISETGPRQYFFGTTPERRGERYYSFEEVDMWVYRTISGVPASWLETHGKQSSVPVHMIPDNLFQKLLGRTRNGEEPSDVRSGVEEDGRWWDEAGGSEDPDGGQAVDGSTAYDGRVQGSS